MKQLFEPGGEGRVLEFLSAHSDRFQIVASPKFISDLYYIERDNPTAFAQNLKIFSIASLSSLASISGEQDRVMLENRVVHVVADSEGEDDRLALLRNLHPTLTFVGLCRDLVPAILARSAHRVTEDLSALPMPADLLVLFATPRSGSSLLGDIIGQMGFGVAREHLRPTTLELLLCGYKFDRAEALRNFLRLEAKDGWVSTKLITHFVQEFFAEGGKTDWLFDALKGVRCHVVGLDRHDRIAQAVSGAIAAQRKMWHHFEGGKQPELKDEEIRYSFDSILSRLSSYAQQGAYLKMWSDFADDLPTLWYEEDIDGQPFEAVARNLQNIIGLPQDRCRDDARFETGRLRIASAVNDRLIAQFRQDWGQRFGREFTTGRA